MSNKFNLICFVDEKYILESCDQTKYKKLEDLEKEYSKPFEKIIENGKIYIKMYAGYNGNKFEFENNKDNSYMYNLFIDSEIKSQENPTFGLEVNKFFTTSLRTEYIYQKKYRKIKQTLNNLF